MTGTKFNGVTLTTPETTKAQRREVPFLLRALGSSTAEDAAKAINQGRAFIERSRDVALEAGRKKK